MPAWDTAVLWETALVNVDEQGGSDFEEDEELGKDEEDFEDEELDAEEDEDRYEEYDDFGDETVQPHHPRREEWDG